MKSLQQGLIKYRRALQAKIDTINYNEMTEKLNIEDLVNWQQQSERAR